MFASSSYHSNNIYNYLFVIRFLIMSGHNKKSGRKHSKVRTKEQHNPEEKQAIIAHSEQYKASDNHKNHHIIPVDNVNHEIPVDQVPNIFSKREWKYVQHVIDCCESEDGFDIYQLMAFDSDTKHGSKDCLKYMFNIIKSVLWYVIQYFHTVSNLLLNMNYII